MNELREYDAMVRRITTTARTIPSRAGTVAVNFTKERFREQNWLDNTAEAWPERKKPKREKRSDRRKILIKSGRLMRSPRKLTANSDRAIIAIDVEYAEAHNEGKKIDATQHVGSYQVREFRRRAHTRTRGGRTERVKAQTIAGHTVKAHTRRMKFTMPQRRFLGTSATLNRRIETMMNNEFNRVIATT